MMEISNCSELFSSSPYLSIFLIISGIVLWTLRYYLLFSKSFVLIVMVIEIITSITITYQDLIRERHNTRC